MESLEITMGMLDLMVRPAFCVKDGIVAGANQDALRLLIQPGTPMEALLPEDAEEYRNFREGCLYMTLHILGQPLDASVTKNGEYEIFVLEQEADHAELTAMALAAQELREPLANVMAVADRLFPVVGTEPAIQDQASRINRGLFQMLRIISNMSDAARYTQETQPRQEMREITAFLEEIFQKAKGLIEQTGTKLEFRNLHENIYTLIDSEKLERGIYNLLSNALKFTPANGTIEVTLTRRGKKLYLTIQDSGTSVDPKLRGSIHERYRRNPGLEDGRFGIGLGMVLIRAAASAHGGTVLMEYPPEKGTRITMTLRIRQHSSGIFHASPLKVDYAGERDHGLMELSDALPAKVYRKDNIN